MEVDLEKSVPVVVNLCMDSWTHVQEVDYDHLPFKCKLCHEYGHFAKGCPKGVDSTEKQFGDLKYQWMQVK